MNCWPLPEFGLNMNATDVAYLGLSDDEEKAIAAFLVILGHNVTP